MKLPRSRQRFRRPRVAGRTLKSGLEGAVATAIAAAALPVKYEPAAFIYQPQAQTYTPDFELAPHIYLESKGRFTAADRNKMLWARRDNPGESFILLFQNPKVKCGRTTAAQWAERHGFRWITLAELPALLEEVKNAARTA